MSDYLLGTDVLGASGVLPWQGASVDAGGGPYVTIHVRDIPGLVRAQGGATGALAQNLLPQTIQNKVYGDIQSEIAKAMKAKGVDAEVKIVSTAPLGGPLKRDFLVGSAVGAGALGLGYAITKIITHLFGRKR